MSVTGSSTRRPTDAHILSSHTPLRISSISVTSFLRTLDVSNEHACVLSEART